MPQSTTNLPKLSEKETINAFLHAKKPTDFLINWAKADRGPLHLIVMNWYSAIKLARTWWEIQQQQPEVANYYWALIDGKTGRATKPKEIGRRDEREVHAVFQKKAENFKIKGIE